MRKKTKKWVEKFYIVVFWLILAGGLVMMAGLVISALNR